MVTNHSNLCGVLVSDNVFFAAQMLYNCLNLDSKIQTEILKSSEHINENKDGPYRGLGNLHLQYSKMEPKCRIIYWHIGAFSLSLNLHQNLEYRITNKNVPIKNIFEYGFSVQNSHVRELNIFPQEKKY